MDPNLLAFILSGCLSLVVYMVIMAFTKGRKRPPNDDDTPKGPITLGI